MSVFESIKTGLEESIAHEEGKINLSTETRESDLISREALRNELLKISICTDNLYGMGILEGLDRATKRVNNASAVDAVEVVHAKWEKFGIDYKHEASLYECSACGKIVRKYWEDERFECCPYCFARMDGE